MTVNDREEVIVHHNGEEYDVKSFLHFHPGGRNTVEHFKGKDITNQLLKYQHSPSAMYLLKEYKTKDSSHRGEDDLEKLVDWSKPMLAQVGKLGSQYEEWVKAPVDRRLRLFQSDFVESLTVTPWYLIPLVWIPFDMYLLYRGISNNHHYAEDPVFPAWAVFCFGFGITLWSFLEYTLHRWLFHAQPPTDSPRLITMHFLMHGLHHKVPFDERRLLIPPVPAAIVVAIFYIILRILFPLWMVDFVAAGTLAGYVVYDLIHFYLHFGSPPPDSYLYRMKRYHNQHHFTEHQNGFGISSSFWDGIFGTEIYLRKLNWSLRW
ncbi:fatty acid 2-hydroxylase [Anabrus simplex]|uniref:fatty acid 2-hydroxylase n=1 Tax=Anabrus simplex TaxID=316456 RepID=UPI0035A2F5BA